MTIPPHLWFRVGGVEGGARQFVFDTVDAGRVLVPWGPHAERVDPCDPDDMTRAELACRQGAAAAFADLRASDPAFAHAWLDDYARMLGITESRRLVGDHVLAKEDGDVRSPTRSPRTGHWTKRGVVYEIPYRCLTTPAASNLLVAGRCISATRYVHQATKEIPAAMATGEAAGTAAAMAAPRASVCARSTSTTCAPRCVRRAPTSGADAGPERPRARVLHRFLRNLKKTLKVPGDALGYAATVLPFPRHSARSERRDAGLARVSTVTRVFVTGSVVATGVFSGLAAWATSGRAKPARLATVGPRVASTGTLSAGTTPTSPITVPAVGDDGGSGGGGGSSANLAPPATVPQTAPATVPAPSYQYTVPQYNPPVVSGGS